jgi:hypothetical protein
VLNKVVATICGPFSRVKEKPRYTRSQAGGDNAEKSRQPEKKKPARMACRADFRQSVPATHAVRRRRSRLANRLRGRRRDGRLTRCGTSCLRLAGTRDQHQGENGKHRTKCDCFFHNMNCFFNKRFVAGRIARRICSEEFFFLGGSKADIILSLHVVWRAVVLCFSLFLNLTAAEIAASADWPPNYIVRENSESPNAV